MLEVLKPHIAKPKLTNMDTGTSLKDDLVKFVEENVVDPDIDDDSFTAENKVVSLLLLKTDDDWKTLSRVKEELIDVSSIPPWLDIGSPDIEDGIDRQLEGAARELQAIFKKHLAPHPKTKKAKTKKITKRPKLEFKWQYKNSKGGWSDYDAKASDFIETVYQGYKANRGDMDVRAVRSGGWEYQVDFLAMKQTNTQHPDHKIRDIRRVFNKE